MDNDFLLSDYGYARSPQTYIEGIVLSRALVEINT